MGTAEAAAIGVDWGRVRGGEGRGRGVLPRDPPYLNSSKSCGRKTTAMRMSDRRRYGADTRYNLHPCLLSWEMIPKLPFFSLDVGINQRQRNRPCTSLKRTRQADIPHFPILTRPQRCRLNLPPTFTLLQVSSSKIE